MYQIFNTADNTKIGTTEKVRFIKKKITGSYVEAKEEEAQGIAYKGTAYNLQGRDGVGAQETVYLIELDAGEVSDNTTAAVAANSAAIDDLIVAMLEV